MKFTGAVLSSLKYGASKNVVTFLCDSGSKYVSKTYDAKVLESNNIPILVKGIDIQQDFNLIFDEQLLSLNGISFNK